MPLIPVDQMPPPGGGGGPSPADLAQLLSSQMGGAPGGAAPPGGPPDAGGGAPDQLSALQAVIQDTHRLLTVLADPQDVQVATTCLQNFARIQARMMGKAGG